MPTARKGATVQTLVQRGAVYALLAHSFAYPDPSHMAALRDIARTCRSLTLGTALEKLAAIALELNPADSERVYIRIFTLSDSPDCPRYETAYLAKDLFQLTAQMADIAGFYRAFGVEAKEGNRPDDICTELEFMSFLCRKQAFAVEQLGRHAARQAARAQRLFLAEHLSRWAPAFGSRVEMHAGGHSFYGAAGHALVDWVRADCARLRVVPREPAEGPGPAWCEPEDNACRAVEAGAEMSAGVQFINADTIPVI